MELPDNWQEMRDKILDHITFDKEKYRKAYLDMMFTRRYTEASMMKRNVNILEKVLSDIEDMNDEETMKYLFGIFF